MSKIIVVPNSKEELAKLLEKDIDGIILNIKNFSVNASYYVNIDELESIIKKSTKEIFVSLNKMIKNKDIKDLEIILTKLNKLNIKGILFYDLAVFQLAQELKITKDLIIYQNHSNNSIYSNNFFFNLGITGSLISNDITLEEIYAIKRKTNMKVMLPVYGHLPMAYSNRYLLTSYFTYLNHPQNNNNYYLKDNNDFHIIKEETEGSTIYNCNILNLDFEFKSIVENNIDYVILFHEFVDNDTYAKTVDKYLWFKQGNYLKEPTDSYKAFANHKTIYKVGSHEKN